MAKIDDIQAQVEMMKTQLEKNSSSGKESNADRSTAKSSGDVSEGKIPDLTEQVKTVLENVGEDLKDSNPVVILGVFVLGLAVGRLFSK